MIIFSRFLGPVPIDCVISENHSSEIEITGVPIETGAEVNDHAYILPKRVTLEIASNAAVATYAALVRFQESRRPFTLVSGLAVYRNMMVKAINVTRDKVFSKILNGSAELQEVIIVDTSYAAAETGDEERPNAGVPARKSARPSPTRSGDLATAQRASGTVQRGDAPASTVPPVIARVTIESVFGDGQ